MATVNTNAKPPVSSFTAYFEQVLMAIPANFFCDLVDKSKKKSSTFDAWGQYDHEYLVNRFTVSCARRGTEFILFNHHHHSRIIGLDLFLDALSSPTLAKILLCNGKTNVNTLRCYQVQDLISVLRASDLDNVLKKCSIDVLRDICTDLHFREDVDDKEMIELAIKDEVIIMGAKLYLSTGFELGDLRKVLVSIYNQFKSVFSDHEFFERSYRISENFDRMAHVLLIMSLAYPHLRAEFKKYILDPANEECKVVKNARALKTAESLLLPEVKEVTSTVASTSTSTGEIKMEQTKVSPVLETKEDKSESETELPAGSIFLEKKKTRKRKEEPMKTEKKKTEPRTEKKKSEKKEAKDEPSTEKSDDNTSEATEKDLDDESDTESGDEKVELPSSKGRVKLERGVSHTDIYVNYSAKEIYDICKYYKIKTGGNSTERCKKIVKFLAGDKSVTTGSQKRKRKLRKSSSKRKK